MIVFRNVSLPIRDCVEDCSVVVNMEEGAKPDLI